jgi:hypothetical protein
MRSRAVLSVASPASPLEDELDGLTRLDLPDLRVRWRKLMRTAPPDHLPRSFLVRVLAYKLQARALGDLDPETARYLAGIERERVRRRTAHEKRAKAPPPVPPVPARVGLKPGAMLIREHAGQTHTVTIVPDGFAWNGGTYTSLSEIARQITGTRWNGPRFFGLRDKAAHPTRSEGQGA